MEGTDDLELSEQGPGTGSSQPVRKNIALKLKPSPKGRGRSKKTTRSSSSSKKPPKQAAAPRPEPEEDRGKDDIMSHDDVLHLAVSGIKPSNSVEPLHKGKRLSWQHKVTLIGQKVVDPSIHCCEICLLPILIYGRMIPCKHVFCFECAKKHESIKFCPRELCKEAVYRIEQSALGTVFMCNLGVAKHGFDGCRRTYLSPRDLKAHIDHRHLKQMQPVAAQQVAPPPHPQAPHPYQRPAIPEYKTHGGSVAMDTQPAPPPPPPPQQPAHPAHPAHVEVYRTRQAPVEDGRGGHMGHHIPQNSAHLGGPPGHAPPGHQPPLPPQQHHAPPPQHSQAAVESYQTIPIMTTSRSTNLITIPIQDDGGPYRRHSEQPPPPPPPHQPQLQSQPPPMSYPPPQGHQQPPPAPYSVPQGPPPTAQYHPHPPAPPLLRAPLLCPPRLVPTPTRPPTTVSSSRGRPRSCRPCPTPTRPCLSPRPLPPPPCPPPTTAPRRPPGPPCPPTSRGGAAHPPSTTPPRAPLTTRTRTPAPRPTCRLVATAPAPRGGPTSRAALPPAAPPPTTPPCRPPPALTGGTTNSITSNNTHSKLAPPRPLFLSVSLAPKRLGENSLGALGAVILKMRTGMVEGSPPNTTEVTWLW